MAIHRPAKLGQLADTLAGLPKTEESYAAMLVAAPLGGQ